MSSCLDFLGLRFSTLGSNASLAIAAPLVEGGVTKTAHTDAARLGLYFDRTPASECIVATILGTDVLKVYAAKAEILGDEIWHAGNFDKTLYQLVAEKSAANGYASLDAGGKVPVGELPAGLGGVTFLGTWDANTNTPVIVSGVGTHADYYIVSVAGATVIDGIGAWAVGDWIIYDTAVWKKVDNNGQYLVKADVGDAFPGYLDTKVDGVTIKVNILDQLEVDPTGLPVTTAASVTVAAGGFAKILSAADTNVQLALATVDAHTHSIADIDEIVDVAYTPLVVLTWLTLDTVAHASYKAYKWFINFKDAGNQCTAVEVIAAYVDAGRVDYKLYDSTGNFSDPFDIDVEVDIVGANVRLRAYTTTAGIQVFSRRLVCIA